MTIDLSKETQGWLEKVKKELGQPSSDDELIKSALMHYYSDLAQLNWQKKKFE